MKAVLVLPTYNERENIPILIPRLQEAFKAIPDHDMNILFVDDDSPDGTADEVRSFQNKWDNIFLITGAKRGLGVAYLRGFSYAIENLHTDVLFMMDSDLSHPPELVPVFMKEIEEGYDLVIGSRYIRGGGTPDWTLGRKLASRLGNIVARLVAGLYRIHDCTSGYRAIRCSLYNKIDTGSLITKGYAFLTTLLYELIMQGAACREIPLIFYDRKQGETKLKTRDILEFMLNAVRIRFKSTKIMLKFALVGSSGVIVNLGIFSGIQYILSYSHLLSDPGLLAASLAGDEVSILYNYFLNNMWTFNNSSNRDHVISKLLKFHVTAAASVVINNSILFILYKLFLVPDIPAKLIGIIVAFFWNYFINVKWTWRED